MEGRVGIGKRLKKGKGSAKKVGGNERRKGNPEKEEKKLEG